MSSVLLLVIFCARAGANLHGKTFANVLNAPNPWFESEPSGRILSRFTGDTDVIDLEWANQVDAWMTLMSMVIMIFVAICILVPVIIPINIVAAIGVVKTLQIINIANRDLKRIANSAISPCVTDATEAEAGQTVARAHGCLSFHVKRQQQNMDNTLAAFFMSSSVQQAAYANATAWCSLLALATSLIIVFAGDAFVPRRLAPIALTYALVAPYFASMLSEVHLQACLYATSLERLFDYLPEVGSLPSEAPREQPADDAVLPNWPVLGALEFKKVSLRYRPGLPLALSSASFRLEPGETCAVCGRTGSHLLSREQAHDILAYRFRKVNDTSCTFSNCRAKRRRYHDRRNRPRYPGPEIAASSIVPYSTRSRPFQRYGENKHGSFRRISGHNCRGRSRNCGPSALFSSPRTHL